ncbi:MAG: hypothetical protein K2I19_05550, partial [Muribaculaceae bacterium]|nr:hypothetical protein [Muribaculaceae bacterium]
QSSCICVRLFRSQCNRIAPSLREHIRTTLDRPSVNKYWGTGSKSRLDSQSNTENSVGLSVFLPPGHDSCSRNMPTLATKQTKYSKKTASNPKKNPKML